MNKAEKISWLKKVDVFSGCSDRQLGAIAGGMHENSKQAGETILREGNPGRVFFVITEGTVKVVINGRTRARLSRGDTFGELSLLTDEPRDASVVAETPVEYLTLTSGNFTSILEGNPPFALGLLRHLAKRLRDQDRSVTS